MLYIYIDRYILGTKRCGVVKVKLELSSFHSGREKVCATGWHCTIYKPRSQIGHILEDFWPCLLEFLLRIKCWTCLQEKKKNVRKGSLEGLLYYHFFAGWKKENLSFSFNYNGISKSRRFVSTYFTVFQKCPFLEPLNQRGIWIESSVVFATEEDGLRPKTRGKYRKQSNPGNRWCSVCQTAPTTTVSFKQWPLSWFG